MPSLNPICTSASGDACGWRLRGFLGWGTHDVMPRTFDTGLRADLLYDAICELIAQGGVGAATTRGIARVAGLSTSSLRHHFDDRGRLLRYVLTRAASSFGPQGWIPAPGDPERGRSMARSLLKGLLPLDEKRHRHAVVAGDLITAARTDPTIADAAEGAELQLAELCELALSWFRWEMPADLDHVELAHLQAVVDGLRRRLCDPHVPLDNDLARAVLQRHLDLMSDA